MLPDPAAIAALLPANARLDLARQESVRFQNPAGGTGIQFDVPDNSFYYLLVFSAKYVANNAATDGSPKLILRDAEGLIQFEAPIPMVVNPGTSPRLTWVATAGSAYFIQDKFAVVPLPPVVALPGQNYLTFNSGQQANDIFNNGYATFLKIPTGPQITPQLRTAATRHLVGQ